MCLVESAEIIFTSPLLKKTLIMLYNKVQYIN